jgi:hypothetical protein
VSLGDATEVVCRGATLSAETVGTLFSSIDATASVRGCTLTGGRGDQGLATLVRAEFTVEDAVIRDTFGSSHGLAQVQDGSVTLRRVDADLTPATPNGTGLVGIRSDVTLEDVTMRGGDHYGPAFVALEGGGELTVTRGVYGPVTSGGAFYVREGTATFTDVSVHDVGGTVFSADLSTVALTRVTAIDSGSVQVSDRGGVVRITDGSVSVADSTFTGNSSGVGGVVHATRSTVDLAGSTLDGNTSTTSGAAVFLDDSALTLDAATWITGNVDPFAVVVFDAASTITSSGASFDGAVDNTPHDLYCVDLSLAADYGDAATFTCAACTCAP